jgi:hypothetical protein
MKPLKRKIWLHEHADYEKLKQNLVSVNWDSLFLTDDIELITNEITNVIRAAKRIIGPQRKMNLAPPSSNSPNNDTQSKSTTVCHK